MSLKNSKIQLQCIACKSRGESHFSDLKDEDLEILSEHKSCVTYKKNQTLFYEGTRPMGIFCINSGKVKVFKMGSNGKEQILFIAQKGDFLGYRSLLSEELYGSSGTVLEPAAICFIPKSDFLKAILAN